ncbi:antitoxin Xre/MbcA/ParS toxin-binding domain-containing protein [Aeromonas hydrophila]|uniref:antitoxin Xre/MbcA/ParS toxin-binding domain-containing protein n=1 Tax=Aeromonas hydrophila TaxID=644 RepID=UPI0004931E41|nr:antitoxin Xre/MbcA/ParS toxin-binding domain-containing protein [Aeromonas hydrophila]HAT1543777.1 DUF2384 domain-containing protein [Aeromonas hydrophila]HAT1554245.1 DUF2384 domain-containing protein [Aeromonas hydrophila]
MVRNSRPTYLSQLTLAGMDADCDFSERCQPHWGLGGKKPVDLLSTAMGVQAVIDLAGQIEHGVY